MAKEKTLSLKQNDFKDQVNPKKLESPKDLFLFRCTKCGSIHFRHAGYVEMLMPYVQANKKKLVDKTSYEVQVCTKCRNCYIWYDSQMYDVTPQIDLEAWAKTEREMHRATGPGGDC